MTISSTSSPSKNSSSELLSSSALLPRMILAIRSSSGVVCRPAFLLGLSWPDRTGESAPDRAGELVPESFKSPTQRLGKLSRMLSMRDDEEVRRPMFRPRIQAVSRESITLASASTLAPELEPSSTSFVLLSSASRAATTDTRKSESSVFGPSSIAAPFR